MIDASVLRAALVAALRDIPALVALVGADADNIVDYVEELNGDLFATVADSIAPRLLVCHTGTTFSGGQTTLWQQNFSIIIRVPGSPSAIFKQVVDGVPASGAGLPMLLHQIDVNYHSMTIPTLQRRVIPVSERSSFDYWEINLGFTSRGFE